MSTTVSYKGQTLTTVSNDTKTLLTEGKYLEDDLTLVDDSGGGSTLITKSISANGTYNASSDSADGYSQVTVAVPASAVDTGTKSITSNGTHDVVGYASASVAVPNSYSASDEGKVVSNGALVAQTSDTVTTNDTYDTTLINSLTVNVSGGGGEDTLGKYIDGTIGDYYNNTITTFESGTRVTSPNITGIFLGSITTIGSYGLTSCGNCLFVVLPSVTSLNTASLNGHTRLQTADFGASLSSITALCFGNDAALSTIVLRKSSALVSLANVTAFNGTPFANGGTGGTIYIPKALYDHLGDGTSSDYKAASNWSTINGYGTITWAKIEGSYYETHYADGTVIA